MERRQPLRALVVDDEALARRGVVQLLAAHDDITVVGECRNGADALAMLSREPVDLLFLDVQMPGVDGFGVMRELPQVLGGRSMPVTVFLTAYEEFALAAFEVEAADYLVKPVSEARFGATLERARRRLAMPTREASPAATRKEAAQILAIPSARGQRIVSIDEIDWIGADDYYAAIYASGRRSLLRETMASLEGRLDPACFVRIHRSAIVNVARVLEVVTTSGDTWVLLRDGTRLPVSRRRRAALKRSLVRPRA